VQLTVYNSAGQKINTLVEETLAAGHHEAIWDGRNYAGYNAASGVYFAVLESANLRQTHSMVLAR
jgi:flagellar hook assembly protein FlgD